MTMLSRAWLYLPLALFLASCQAGTASKPPAQSTAPAKPAPAVESPAPAPSVGKLAPGEPKSAVPVEEDDIRLGAADADATLVAFLDLDCHFCRESFEVLETLRERYKPSELRLVIKQLPLQSHPSALPAAMAAQAVQLAAGSEAAYSMMKQLFRSGDLGVTALADTAKLVGLDRQIYNDLVEQEDTFQRVVADVYLSRKLGVTGTPAFFLNGALIAGSLPLSEWTTRIDAERKAFAALRQGRSFAEAYPARVAENSRSTLADAMIAADPQRYRVPIGNSPVLGPPDALVTLVVFSDFECPFCKRADATVTKLTEHYGNRVRLVFKQAPLPFHPHARPAARLSQLIFQKGGASAFWAAARDLFAASPELGPETLTALGSRYGLGANEITTALDGSKDALDLAIDADQLLGDDVEAEGTPHFFVNGYRLAGARPYEHFEALIDHELRHAEKLVQAGLARDQVYSELQKDAAAPGAPALIDAVITERDRPFLGNAKAPFVLHVFSDFQCPFCRKGEETVAELKQLHGDQLRVVWHDMPLDFHARALPAARAGREAYRQKGNEGFWKMHHLLFGLDVSASLVEEADLEAHATTLGLDMRSFKKALEGGSDASIHADKDIANQLDIRGTPAFVLQRSGAAQGYLLTGLRPRAHFERILGLLAEPAPKTETASPAAKP